MLHINNNQSSKIWVCIVELARAQLCSSVLRMIANRETLRVNNNLTKRRQQRDTTREDRAVCAGVPTL